MSIWLPGRRSVPLTSLRVRSRDDGRHSRAMMRRFDVVRWCFQITLIARFGWLGLPVDICWAEFRLKPLIADRSENEAGTRRRPSWVVTSLRPRLCPLHSDRRQLPRTPRRATVRPALHDREVEPRPSSTPFPTGAGTIILPQSRGHLLTWMAPRLEGNPPRLADGPHGPAAFDADLSIAKAIRGPGGTGGSTSF